MKEANPALAPAVGGSSVEVRSRANVARSWIGIGAGSSAFLIGFVAQAVTVPAFSKTQMAISHNEQDLTQLGFFSATTMPQKIASLFQKAERIVQKGSFEGLLGSDQETRFEAKKASSDLFSTTIRYAQKYNGLDVVGNEAFVHFDSEGNVHDVAGAALQTAISTTPSLPETDATRILWDRYQERVELSEAPKLKVLQDFTGRTHLVYHVLTKTSATHAGQEVYVVAHDGSIVLEFDRAYHAGGGSKAVYSADTERAHEHVDPRGYPTDLDMSWYDKVIENGQRFPRVDRSALNAYRNAGRTYDYYKDTFNRASYDGQDSPIVSVVHMGQKMNNAFWTSEYKLMAYGDGDGERMTDLTYGLDVTAHELTHGVTATSAQLVYAAESGALNEHFSDFFGKMVDYNDGDWDIGARIMAPAFNRRALRNMKNPEEFRQPGVNDSPLRVSTTGPCTRGNDRCGVHTNSGIPNRASVLIVEAIGKEKSEQLYYKVLTTRLSATATFHDMREQTLAECALLFGGANSQDCTNVKAAFDTVKM